LREKLIAGKEWLRSNTLKNNEAIGTLKIIEYAKTP